jgi:hypothetical protein
MKETVIRYLIPGENPIPLAFYDTCAETKLRQRSRKRRSWNLCGAIWQCSSGRRFYNAFEM